MRFGIYIHFPWCRKRCPYCDFPIAVAKEAGAADLAAFHLRAAEKYLASAEQKLSERAYNQARRDAKQAKMKALDALKASEDHDESAKD